MNEKHHRCRIKYIDNVYTQLFNIGKEIEKIKSVNEQISVRFDVLENRIEQIQNELDSFRKKRLTAGKTQIWDC